MQPQFYVGLDVHKKTIDYAIKLPDGQTVGRGRFRAQASVLREQAAAWPKPWRAGLESTLFTAWIYDVLAGMDGETLVAHPARLRAISQAKHTNDRIAAAMLADMLRANLFPSTWVAPEPLRSQRRLLRHRNRLVRQQVAVKNAISGVLMEIGQPYQKSRLHGRRYWGELLDSIAGVPDDVSEVLRIDRSELEFLQMLEGKMLKTLLQDPELNARVKLLRTIPGVGLISALTWALEIGDISRFPCIDNLISYCGLCAGEKESGGASYRQPLSKQRNKYLQVVLIEAARIGLRVSPELKATYEKERLRGHENRAALAVARKMVAYLAAVDRSGKPFVSKYRPEPAAAIAAT